jgi:hypothetical protein
MVKEGLLNPSLQWSKPRPTKDASEAVPAPTRFERMEATTLRRDQTSDNEPDEGDEWASTLADHIVLTELGIPYGRRLLGEGVIVVV